MKSMRWDKTAFIVVLVCSIGAIVGFAYIITNTYVSLKIEEIEQEQIVDLNNISMLTITGTINFVINETNSSITEIFGPSVYVSIYVGGDSYILSFENQTKHDKRLIDKLLPGLNCTITFVDFYSFSMNEPHAVPRNNILVDVEEMI